MRETLQGGRAPARQAPPVGPAAALTSVEVKRLLATCPTNLAGTRDRALFLVGFARALRRSELVAIDHKHLRFESDCVVIRLVRSKTDQQGEGADISLPRMRGTGAVSDIDAVPGTCPVRALERWLARANIRRGAVFRTVSAHGKLGERLRPDAVRHILLPRAALAKLTVH